jgi:phosphatidylglycerophosphatase C
VSKTTHSENRARGIALFDMDQTLVQWDTQLLFCNWVLRHEPGRRLFLLMFLPFLPLARVLGSEGMKRVFLSFLWRMRRERLDELVAGFVAHYVPAGFYPEVLEEVKKEKAKGRLTVMTSASPEMYAKPIGEALGFDVSLGTRVEFGEVVPLFPEFTRGNNKGAVKVDRLREELDIELVDGKLPDSAGYSDSKADLPMLEICEEVTAIHPEGSYAQRAADQGWRVMNPQRLWKDRREFAWACLRMVLGAFPP